MTDGITASFDPSTYQTVWEGEGGYLAFDIYSTDGTLSAGTYTANSVGGTINPGEFGIGYDTDVDWGFGPMHFENWGTCWWTVSGGTATATKVLDGTMTVAIDGETYTITIESSVIKARYVGPFTVAQ